MGREGPKYAHTQKIQKPREQVKSLTLAWPWWEHENWHKVCPPPTEGGSWTSHRWWAAARSTTGATLHWQPPRDSQWPNQLIPLTDKWGCILIPLEAKSTNIYAMAKPSYSWFKMTWAPDNLLEDPLVTGLLKWSLVVKNKLIKVNIFVVEEQF